MAVNLQEEYNKTKEHHENLFKAYEKSRLKGNKF